MRHPAIHGDSFRTDLDRPATAQSALIKNGQITTLHDSSPFRDFVHNAQGIVAKTVSLISLLFRP